MPINDGNCSNRGDDGVFFLRPPGLETLAHDLDRPVNITLNLPSLPDAAVVEIQDFLYGNLDLCTTRYDHQVDRFYDGLSYDNLVHRDPNPPPPDDDPPF